MKPRNKYVPYKETVRLVIVVIAALWLVTSAVIFRFRHPGATETELFLHLPDAFLLRELSEDQKRSLE